MFCLWLVVVHLLHLFWTHRGPFEAYTVLVIDADAMLPDAIPTQQLQPVARWDPQILEGSGVVELVELAGACPPCLMWKPLPSRFCIAAVEEVMSCGVTKGKDQMTSASYLT